MNRKKNDPGAKIRLTYLLIIWGLVFLFIGYGVFLGTYGHSMDELFWWILIPTIGICALIFYIVIRKHKDENTYGYNEVTAATLQEQLAKGDITYEQYSRMNKEIHDRTRDYILIRQ